MRRTTEFFGRCLGVWLLVVSGGQWATAQTASEAPRAVCVATVLKPDGSPADNATVTAQYWTKETGTVRLVVTPAKPDAGKFEIEVPELPLGCTVAVRAEAPGYLRMVVRYNSKKNEEPELPDAVTFKLQEGRTTLGGVVVDGDGKPFEGARVGVWFTPDPANRKPNPPGIPVVDNLDAFNATYTTDKDGKWTGPAVPPGTKAAVKLGVHSVLAANEDFYFLLVDADFDRLLDGTYRSVLKRGLPLKGKVVDETGAPVAGAAVGFSGFGTIPTALPPVRTDATGEFVLGVASGRPLSLLARAPGRAAWTARLVAPTDQPLVITLKPAVLLTGHVLGPDGNPVPKATVYVQSLASDPNSRWDGERLTTDAAGQFRWTESPAEPVLADVIAPPLARNRDVKLTPGQDNVIRLIRPAVFRGTVVDAETGQAVKDFSVDTGIDFEGQQPVESAYWFDSPNQGDPNRSNFKPGNPFTVTFDFPYWRHAVRVRAEGYAPLSSKRFQIADGDQTFEFRLVKSPDQVVRVTGPDGKPAVGAKVALVMRGTPVLLADDNDPPSRSVSFTTDAAGTFKLPAQDGPFRLLARAESGGLLTEQLTTEKLATASDLRLQSWASLSIESDLPKDGEKRAVQIWRYEDWSIPSWQSIPDFRAWVQVELGADGKTKLPRILPGKYRVAIVDANSGRQLDEIASLRGELKPGEDTTLSLRSAGRSVVLKIKPPDKITTSSTKFYVQRDLSPEWTLPYLMPDTLVQQLLALQQADRFAALKKWYESEEGKTYQSRALSHYLEGVSAPAWRYDSVQLELTESADTLQAKSVPPGKYRLSLIVQTNNPQDRKPGPAVAAFGTAWVTIPQNQAGSSAQVELSPEVSWLIVTSDSHATP